MNEKTKTVVVMLLILILSQFCFSSQTLENNTEIQALSLNPFGSTVIFPVTGSVLDGYYSVTLEIGNPPIPYILHIDTGGDLTWIQCEAPSASSAVLCEDPLCDYVDHPPQYPCKHSNDSCYYMVQYLDGSSSFGMLLRDSFLLHFTTGHISTPSLTFGCEINQEIPPNKTRNPSQPDGVLGLGNSHLNIVSQLRDQRLTQSVFGHCLGNSREKEGFLFFGADILLPPGTVFAPMVKRHESQHIYSPGFADLLFDGQTTPIQNLDIVFDSGATYTYFKTQAYEATLSIVKSSLSITELIEISDAFLPVCWQGPNPYESIDEVKDYFKNLGLIFSKDNNVQFQLPPEAYLIISPSKNVCFGIFDGATEGLVDVNLIGDISLQDKLVIYDDERKLIGWAPWNCTNMPKPDHDYSKDLTQSNVGNLSTMTDQSPEA